VSGLPVTQSSPAPSLGSQAWIITALLAADATDVPMTADASRTSILAMLFLIRTSFYRLFGDLSG
jgi:hypothetical protein